MKVIKSEGMDIFNVYRCYTWGGKDRRDVSTALRRACAICPCPKCKQPVCASHEAHACNAKKVGHDLVCGRCCHPEDGLAYYFVGKKGATALGCGRATLIRRMRTPTGLVSSYLYYVRPEDDAWQKEQAPTPANLAKRQFWGRWMEGDMVKDGKYPLIREITEEKALLLIEQAPAVEEEILVIK